MKRMIQHFSFLTALVTLFALLTVAAYAATPDVVFATETQLTVYVDNQWSSTLSGSYGFGDTATLTAPAVSGKNFSHWTADGSIVSYDKSLKLTMNAHTTLYAVYANAAPTAKPVAGFTSITRTNDGAKISFQAIASGETAGIIYSTTATGEALTVGATGVTNEAAVKSTDLTNTLPKSILDNNNCWMLQIIPDNANTVYHARAYVTDGGETTYSDEKTVKLSDLNSGITLIANPGSIDPETDLDDALDGLTIYTVTFEPNGGVGATMTQAFVSGQSVTLRANTFTHGDYFFKGWNTAADGSGTDYADKAAVNLTENLTLYAQWSKSSGSAEFQSENNDSQINGIVADEKTTLDSALTAVAASLAEKVGGDVKVAVQMNLKAENDLTNTADDQLSETQKVKKSEQKAILDKAAEYFSGDSGTVKQDFLAVDIIQTTTTTNEGGTEVTQTEKIEEMSRVVEIPIRYNLTGRFNPIVFRFHDTAARALTRLAARPQAGSYRDGYYFISGSDSGAVIYIYSNLFSTYSVATSGTKSYTVFFDPNGGTVSQTSAQTDANGKLANLPTPTRSGYTFNGWYDAQTGGSSVTKDTAFTTDSTIYARWTPAGGNNNPAPVYSGSSGGSSDSDDTRYKVTAGEAQHGTVSVSSTSTSSGTKVTITVKPDKGYAVDTVTVTGTNGKNVAVTKVNDTTYTYIQPGMDVKTDVTFRTASVTDALAVFSDVNASDWYADAVRWAVENGVMNGIGGGKFNPNGETSRGMVVTMLWRLEGSPAYAGASEFADVKNEDWYGQAVRWASAEGIVTGYEQDGGKVFNPNGAVKREQLATMLYRYAQHKGQGFTGLWSFPLDYPDASSVSEWAYEAMCWMTMNGVINGMDGKLAPASGASRAQVATMLMRYCTSAAK